MHIRDATPDDIPRITEIWIIAYSDDPDYGTIFPWRAEFPADYQRLWTTRITAAFPQGEERYLVVETDDNGGSRAEVVGWASWLRKGSSCAARKIRADNNGVLKGLERRLRGLEETFVHPVLQFFQLYTEDRIESPIAEKYYSEHKVFEKGFWTGDIEEHWFMSKLTVDPKWRRKGIGMMLLQWGFDRAQEENTPVGLESSRAGRPLYLKAGFVEIKRYEWPEAGFSVPILLWRPKTDLLFCKSQTCLYGGEIILYSLLGGSYSSGLVR